MALVATTLASACGASDRVIVVASATSIAAGVQVRVDDEFMMVTREYVNASTTVPVLRAQFGTTALAHPATAEVFHGAPSDTEWGTSGAAVITSNPLAGRAERILSYSASGAIDLPSPGNNRVAVLNAVSTTILAMTVAAPSKSMDGSRLTILSRNGTGAHTITFAGGLNGAGSSYDVFTFPAGPVMIEVMAMNEVWYVGVAPAITGTVTLLTGGIA